MKNAARAALFSSFILFSLRLLAHRGQAGEASAADEPAFATRPAPDYLRGNSDRISVLVRNSHLNFAGLHPQVVDQADARGRNLATERRVASTVVGMNRNRS